MPRNIRTFLPVVGDPDALVRAFEDDPRGWLPGARRDGPDAFVFQAPARSFSRSVRATVGSPWRHGQTRWRSISWDPVADDGNPGAIDRFLPSLDGELGLHVASPERVTLVLDARYEPPGGAVGLAADTLALNRVARGTVEHVLAEVAARLSAQAMLDPGPTPTPPAEATSSAGR